MYITADGIEKEISFYYPIDNRNGNIKKVGLIRAYFVYSFYNVENDEKIHLKNGETLKVKRGCYTGCPKKSATCLTYYSFVIKAPKLLTDDSF